MDDDYDTLLKKYANKSERPKDEEEGALDENEDAARDKRRKESDKRRTDKSRDKRDRSRDRRRSRERSRDRRRNSRERDRSRERKRGSERRASRDKSRDRSGATEVEHESSDANNKWGGLRERSVDEWDALRAELGLPPLEKSSAAPESAATASTNSAPEPREMSLADKLEVMKHARLMKQKEKKVKTLGDADSDEEGADSSVDWIQRSRAIEEEKKRALMRQRMLEEEEEQARAARPVSVQGLKVGHELAQLDSDLREGEERVLTLKDNYLLDAEGQEDELLDTTLLEKEKWEKIHSAKKKKSRYETLDDPQAAVLSKYDEEKKKEGFVLGGDGAAPVTTARPSPDEVRDQLQRAAQSLDSAAPATSSDYWTNEEIAEFKKNSGAKKKKRKLRKKSALSELFEQEAAHPQQGAEEDLASRSERQQRQEEQSAQDRDTRLQRWKNYDKALEKAQGDSQMLFDASTKPRPESEVSYHEDEEDLFRELARARKLAARDKKKKRPEEVVSELLTAVKREEEAQPHTDEELVFTESTEFVRSLPTEQDERQEEQERLMKRERRTVRVKREPEPQRDDDALMREIEADQPVIRPPAPRRAESEDVTMSEVKEEPQHSTASDDTDSVHKEHAALSEALGDTGAEVRGVGGMLAMLRSMGESSGPSSAGKESTKKDKDERRPKRLDAELALGRATDKRVLEVPLNDERETEALQRRHRHELGMLKKPLNLSGITLEHHDQETGRVLTPKEAFRRMSYVFHGKGPGKNKAEKRKKQDEKRLKQLTQHSMGTETISMQEMQKIQQENKTPYIVLGASAKIFQARDTKPLAAPSATNTNAPAASTSSAGLSREESADQYGISLPSHRPKIELSFKTPAKK